MAKQRTSAVTALEKLADQLTCSVCLEEYTRPRVLPCLHVFCEACLQRLVVGGANRLSSRCPNCRQVAQLPGEGVTTLPSAFYIQHLFEVKDTLEKVKDPSKVQCEKCGEGQAQGFCRDCGQFICQLCLTMHRKWKEFQGHEISSLDEVEATASKMVPPKKVTVMCPKHPTEPIKIYCETCGELICRDCTVKAHRDHNYDLVPDAYPKHRDAIIASLEPIKQQLASVDKIVSELDRRSKSMDKEGKKAKREVDAEFNKLHAILDARRKELHCEINKKVHQASKELAAQRDQHELTQAQLSSCVEFVEGSLQSGTQEEVLSMRRQVMERMRHMVQNFDPKQLQLGPEQVLSVICGDLSPACQTHGEVHFVQFQGTHVKTISGMKRPRHITFAATGEMVVCERDAHCVSVYDRSYRHLRSFGNTGPEEKKLSNPLGVAISSDNTVFVAANHCVKKFTLEGQFIASVGTEGSGRLQFNWPGAIACSAINKKVYVCDTANHRVVILNLDLTFHASFGSRGSNPGQFSCPAGISVDINGNVAVADRNNKRIQIFDASGQFLSAITHTMSAQQLQGPVSVSVEQDNSVYVLEQDSYRISIFSHTGKYITSFSKKEDKDGGFGLAYCVAVSDQGLIYVSDTDSNRIQVFK